MEAGVPEADTGGVEEGERMACSEVLEVLVAREKEGMALVAREMGLVVLLEGEEVILEGGAKEGGETLCMVGGPHI